MTKKQPSTGGKKDKKRDYEFTRTPKPKDFIPESHFGPNEGKRSGKKRCKGWSSRNGRQCRAYPVVGKTSCKHCGGMTPSGPLHPRYKHGRSSSEYLTGLRKEDFKSYIDDPQLLSLQSLIAQCESEVAECIRREKDGLSDSAWAQLKDFLPDLRSALHSEDYQQASAMLGRLEALVSEEASKARARIERGEWIDRRASLSNKERQIRLEVAKWVDKSRVVVWLQGMFETFYQAVDLNIENKDDKKRVLTALQAEVAPLRNVLTAPVPQAPQANDANI